MHTGPQVRDALSSATIALEISSRNERVATLQNRGIGCAPALTWSSTSGVPTWPICPGGASGLLCRDYKGKEADRLVVRIDPGVVLLVAELRGHGRQGAGELEQSKTARSAR
jgi:hypothetical protein